MQPLNEISVVIPMYNAEETIITCLDSVFSKLKNLREVIVVDDCSSDRSAQMASRFPCRIIRLKERGFAGRARNLGAKEVKGRYILFLDSDVALRQDISRQIEEDIKPEKKIIAVVGLFSQEHPNRNLLSQYKNLFARYKYAILPYFISSLHTSITAIDREFFWKMGGFDERSRVEDVELGESIVRQGYRIYLNKEIDVVHLKKYNLKNMLVTDFQKAIGLSGHFRNIKDKKRIFREGFLNDISFPLFLSMLSGSTILPLFLVAIFFKPALILVIFSFLTFVAANMKFWSYLAAVNGVKFALLSSGVTFINMNCVALASSINLIKSLSCGAGGRDAKGFRLT